MNVFIVNNKGNSAIISNCISEACTEVEYKIIKVHPPTLTKKEKTKLITLNDLPVFLNSNKNNQGIEVGEDDLDIIKSATNLYIGLEPDKYNQYCADKILRKADRVNSPNKRIWFDAITPKNIKYSLLNAPPNENYTPISIRYELERSVNYLVGMNLSVLFSAVSQILGHKIWVSLSKDKLKILRYIVDSLNEIKETAHIIDRKINVITDGGVQLTWVPNEAYLDDSGYMANHGHQNQVLRLLKDDSELILKEVNQSDEQSASPPAPLNINSLFALVKEEYPQLSYQEARKTLWILYYKGYILNPDTFQEKYHERHRQAGAAFIKELKQVKHHLSHKTSLQPINEIYTDEIPAYLHGALMPIRGKIMQSRNLKNLERFIYSLIVKYFVAQYCNPYITKKIEYKFKANKSHEIFSLNTTEVIDYGWKNVIEQTERQNSPLKARPGDAVKISKIMPVKQYPTPLLSYSRVFEHFASTDTNVWNVLEGLKDSGYIKTSDNGALILTYEGSIISKVLDKVPNYDELIDKIDQYLDNCTTEASIGAVQDAIEHDVGSYISDTFRLLNNEGIKKCPQCLSGYMAKITKDQSEFMGCCNFPSCDYTEDS